MAAIPIRKCAKEVGKSREYVRKLVDDGEVIAIVAGGSDDAPWLLVDPDDVRSAMKRLSVYVPKKLRGTRHQRPGARRGATAKPSETLSAFAAAM